VCTKLDMCVFIGSKLLNLRLYCVFLTIII
jgi:hypothetical protein